MTDSVQSLLSGYIVELKKIYGRHLQSVILYGSYARGDFTKDSDVDIMILLNLTDEEVTYILQNELPYLSYKSGAVGLSGTNFTNVGFKQNQMTTILIVIALAVGAYFIFKK